MNALSTTFHELFADNLALCPDKVALVDADRSVSYAALGAEVEAIAARLRALGVTPGARVIVHLRKSIAEAAAMFAVSRIGAVVVNVNIQWTPDQLAYVAGDCGAAAVLTEGRSAQALAGRTDLPPVEVLDGPATGGRAAVVPRLDTELAMIIYTSGSTGRPKGVMLTHRNIVAGARSVARYLGLTPDDRLLSVLPYSFDYGLNQLTTMMLLGGTVVHQPLAMATEIVASINRHRITGLAAVPPLWAQVVRYLDGQLGSGTPVALPSLRRVTNSGGKIPLNILDRMPEVFPGVSIFLMYGLTEAFRSTFLPPEKFAAKKGSIGRAIPGAEVHVVREGIGIAGPGEQGELVHRGPLVSLGYWGRPDVTAEKIRPCPELGIGDEPVVWSGDTVRVDADGDLWFVGRTDAMIKTSGFRLSPDEVEDLVCRSGLVGDAVAFGVEDDDLGQVVHVALSPLTGYDEAALLAHCRKVMPSYMVPRRLHVWSEPMPRTASGKLARPDVVRLTREAALVRPSAAE